jgi:hypothetical protein
VGYFIIGGTVDVIEYRARQPSLGEKSEVMKVAAIAQIHGARPWVDAMLRRGRLAATALAGESM